MKEKLKNLEVDACTVRQGSRKWGNLADNLEDTKGWGNVENPSKTCTSNSKANVLDKTKGKRVRNEEEEDEGLWLGQWLWFISYIYKD